MVTESQGAAPLSAAPALQPKENKTMITIDGKYTEARVFTDELEDLARTQIRDVCNHPAFEGSRVRIMPDVHAGAGCVIGFTAELKTDKVIPNLIGVDIGCGVLTARLAGLPDFSRFDERLRERVPFGWNTRSAVHQALLDDPELDDEISRICVDVLRTEKDRHRRSVGSLGGGNHFIEVDRGSDRSLYLVVHSGSRHLGTEVANFYQDEGRRALWGGANYQIQQAITELKAQGRQKEIESTIKQLKKEHHLEIPKDLAYVEGRLFEDYIHDMKIVQHFATLNRKAMTDVILRCMGLTRVDEFTTIHNYIDTDDMILRKGSVSAKAGEKLLIPINMRDGSLLCIGKGNEDWNCSAPHGAGRLMSRKAAFDALSMEEFEAEMQGIYTTCVVPDTLDESPMAYKSMDEIVSQIGPTATIVDCIKPIYNFKAAD